MPAAGISRDATLAQKCPPTSTADYITEYGENVRFLRHLGLIAARQSDPAGGGAGG